MYQCNLTCIIISSEQKLEQILRSVPSPERFTITFKTIPVLEEADLKQADLLILDGLRELSLSNLAKEKKESAQIFLCASGDRLSALSEEELSCLDGLWPTPDSEAGLRFSYRHLLKDLKTAKDGWLAGNYLDTLIDSLPDLIWFKDVRGSHLKVNNSFCQTVGKTKEQVQGRGHYYIWDLEPEDYAKGEYVCLETEDEVMEKKETCLFDEVVKGKNGLRQFQTYKSPLFDTDGSLIGTLGFAHDVTNLNNIDKELEILLQSLPFAVIVLDSDNNVLNVNTTFTEKFHISEEDISRQNYHTWRNTALIPDNSIASDMSENVMKLADRDEYFLVFETPIVDIFHNHIGFFCVLQDVTTELKLRQQIIHSANTDFLTGLYNRRYLYEYMKLQGSNHPVSLFSIDLDNFKHINDTYGHQFGDKTIVTSAKLIEEHFPDGFVARMGGDEFLVVLMGNCGQEELVRRASSLLESFKRQFSQRSEWSQVSASIGITCATLGTMPLEDMIHCSDLALYEAKNAGKSCWHFYSADDDIRISGSVLD